MRRYGLLLHISSLPSAWGIGDLGPAAHAFAAALAGAGAAVWQFLPLNPTSTFIGNSPYSSLSAFAGNALFISPDFLAADGWVSHADLETAKACLPQERALAASRAAVDYDAVTRHREHLLRAAFERNCPRLAADPAFQAFCRGHDHWLHDHARFISMKEAHHGAAWIDWPKELRLRYPEALEAWDRHAGTDMLREKFIQFLFFSQWMRLRSACNAKGVSLLADVPIYVTHDSVDVWAQPHYFNLDEDMAPVTVSGVPPDYFSETGQRWGSPIYRWDVMEADGFAWWKRRLAHVLLMADMLRLDHFRGFCGYWEIPAEEETAVNGRWVRAPAVALFTALREHFGSLPFLAEDLGVITDDVRAAMRAFALPGMHVLQFAFGGDDFAENSNIPHLHLPNAFVYTGTHDNPPSRAWFGAAPALERKNFSEYLGYPVEEPEACARLIRLAFASVAECSVVPMQDVLNLGAEGRMNSPGLAFGNWTWRMTPEQADGGHLEWIARLARLYGRSPAAIAEQNDAPEDGAG